MIIAPFELTHFDQIEWQESQAGGLKHFRRDWAEEIAATSNAMSAIDADGYVVACAGVIPTRITKVVNGPETVETSLAWAIFSPRLPKRAKSVFKAIKHFLAERREYRIEAYVLPPEPKAAVFLERLGFMFEREVSDSGLDLWLYALVRN